MLSHYMKRELGKQPAKRLIELKAQPPAMQEALLRLLSPFCIKLLQFNANFFVITVDFNRSGFPKQGFCSTQLFL